MVSGHTEQAIQVLRKAARWQKVQLPPEEEVRQFLLEQVPAAKNTPTQPTAAWGLLRRVADEAIVLLRTPRLRTITVCLYINYGMASMVYFGLSLSGGNISKNPFIYVVLTGLMEVPGYTLTIPAVQRFGRRPTATFCFMLCSVSLFALAITSDGSTRLVVALAMVGKMAITGAYQATIFYSSELFPTEVRSRGIGTSCMMSRVGSMVAPFITDLVGQTHRWAPSVVFGAAALVAGASTMLLPETRGSVLPDTVAQLEHSASAHTPLKDACGRLNFKKWLRSGEKSNEVVALHDKQPANIVRQQA